MTIAKIDVFPSYDNALETLVGLLDISAERLLTPDVMQQTVFVTVLKQFSHIWYMLIFRVLSI